MAKSQDRGRKEVKKPKFLCRLGARCRRME